MPTLPSKLLSISLLMASPCVAADAVRYQCADPQTLLAHGHDANIAVLTKVATGPGRDLLRNMMGDRRHLIVDEFQDLPGVRGDLVLALLALSDWVVNP